LHRACRRRRRVRHPAPLWVHEIKHDGYRLMVLRRDGLRVRCFSRNGHDWADRFPAIVEAAARLKAQSFLIDGEAVITSDDGMSDFRALRSRRRGHEAVLFAFDLIEHDAADLRDLPLIERKRQLGQQPGGSTALSSALPGIAFAVWLLDCYASSGSLDLSMHVGISPCRSSSARMRAASLVKSHRWQ
jgi:ATP dependent DNA ligase domain